MEGGRETDVRLAIRLSFQAALTGQLRKSSKAGEPILSRSSPDVTPPPSRTPNTVGCGPPQRPFL